MDEEESLGEWYAQLDSTDCDVVAELVGSLQTNDLLAIHEGEQDDEGAKRYPHFAAMILVCILAKCQLSLLKFFAHFVIDSFDQ